MWKSGQIKIHVRELIFWRQISLCRGFWSKSRPVVQSSEIGGSLKPPEMILDPLFTASWQEFFGLFYWVLGFVLSFSFLSALSMLGEEMQENLPTMVISYRILRIPLTWDMTLDIRQIANILGVATTYLHSNVLKVKSWIKLLDKELTYVLVKKIRIRILYIQDLNVHRVNM